MVQRILIVSTFFPPLNSVASLRPYSWAKYWTEAGHAVDVLTTEKPDNLPAPLPYSTQGFNVIAAPMPRLLNLLKAGYQTNQPGHEKSKSFSFKTPLVRAFNYLRFKKGIFNSCRMPDFSDFWILPALKALKKQEWDVVVSTAGPYSVHLIAECLKRRGQTSRWIADYRDTWSDSCVYPGLFPFNWVEKKLEKKLLQQADAITTVSDFFTHSLGCKHGSYKVHTIENGFDLEDLKKLDPAPFFPLDGMFRIVHTGSLYLGKRDPSPLFQAISELREEPALNKLEVLFVGANQANLQELIDRYQVGKWVKVRGLVSREDALRMQRDARALLFLPWNDLTVDGVMTGKLFEYLCSGTPILAVGASEREASQQLILDAKCGEAFHSASSIKTYLQHALLQINKTKTMLDPALAAKYDRKALAHKLLGLV